ncbi:signal peptidase I [Candidatus Pacearchaeota archaeon]|nr:signal peptidase I [Candidatus Pacearchaeota archaeon]
MVKSSILIFLLGFFSCVFLFYVLQYSSLEIPSVTGLASISSATISPSDRISNDDIIILKDKIILNIPEATLSSYADTGSMKPFFDEGANGIRIKPTVAEEIKVGDIISYRSFGFLVVHRVTEKGQDNKGIYFMTKGDNNSFSDGKIRFKDIEYITIGILY